MSAGLWTACVGVLNGVLPLEWPVLGPALFGAVAVPLVLATTWYGDKSVWLPVLVLVAAVGPFLWLKSRYGGPLSDPDHQWQHVTPGESIFLAGLGVLAYFIGVAGVARQRRQEPLSVPKLIEWLSQILERTPAENLKFRSAEDAQEWVEWNSKGVMLPGMLFFFGGVAFFGWLLFNRQLSTLTQGIFGTGMVLPLLAGIVGLILGNFGPSDNNSIMGPWIASRPLTSAAIARVVLKTQFRAVATCTVAWQLAMWAVMAVAGARVPQQELPPAAFAAANWLLPWAAASVGMLVCLTGRSGWIGVGSVILMLTTMVTGLIVRWTAGGQMSETFFSGALIVVSIAVIAGTVVSFVAAIRRGMISLRTVAVCAVIVAVLIPLVVWQLRGHELMCLVGAAIVVWSVAPFPMAPLAVAWNRNR
ncbi:hypothetical protein AYO47_03290 [Planctomyces sp. SCGC AG-212-M04]|nr:hypothetical protein AYO47_03290 [Planctomyces sp. SCGC AG-212-M04]